MRLYLTFDVGTTAMKACVFDKEFNQKAFFTEEYELQTPERDLVEIDANIYWETFIRGIKSISNQGIDLADIVSVTITTQGETLILVDDTLNPVHNAIVWLDARAERQATRVKELFGRDNIYRYTGLNDITGATPLAKIVWIKDKKPELYEKTYKFLLLEDFLISKLTDRCVSEKSLLSSTGYFDINNATYWREVLEGLDIDVEKLPMIYPCGSIITEITLKAADETGLSKKTLVITGAMDQVASAIGAGNIEEGIITETTGTALVISATVDKPNYDNKSKLTVYRHYGDQFLYIPYCNTAGIVLKWFKDTFLKDITEEAQIKNCSVYDLINKIIEETDAGSNGIIALCHFSGKPLPRENYKAKGVFYDVGLDTTRADFIRAIFEGIACILEEFIAEFRATEIKVEHIYSLGGGSKSRIWNQIKASMCGVPVSNMNLVETTSLGAAILAMVAMQEYESVEEACKIAVKISETFYPRVEEHEIYKAVYEKYIDLYNALNPLF